MAVRPVPDEWPGPSEVISFGPSHSRERVCTVKWVKSTTANSTVTNAQPDIGHAQNKLMMVESSGSDTNFESLCHTFLRQSDREGTGEGAARGNYVELLKWYHSDSGVYCNVLPMDGGCSGEERRYSKEVHDWEEERANYWLLAAWSHHRIPTGP
eukprot:1651999-Rhodomonas_salina.3